MATHSSVLAWRIPGTGEPGGLPSMLPDDSRLLVSRADSMDQEEDTANQDSPCWTHAPRAAVRVSSPRAAVRGGLPLHMFLFAEQR